MNLSNGVAHSIFGPNSLVGHNERIRDIIIIVVLCIVSSVIFYTPYLISGDMDTVFKYWDGPNYAFLAKTLYSIPDKHVLSPYSTSSYFAAHLPVYPVTIKLFSFMGYNNAMLFTTQLYTILATVTLYQLMRECRLVKRPLLSALLSLFIPARYLIYHNVGATEAPFLFFVSLSLLYYQRQQYFWAFLFAGISGITRITGVLLGVSYFLALCWERRWKTIPLLGLVGIPLFALFCFYHFHYGSFFAYFAVNASTSNSLIHLTPTEVFLNYAASGNSHSSEFYLWMYAIYGIGVCSLWNINRSIFFYAAVHYVFCLFIFHQDLARYLIPIAPFALVIAFDKVLSRKSLWWAYIPLSILSYLYAWKMLPHNAIVDWVYKDLIQYLGQ